MAFKSILKPEHSIMSEVVVAAGVLTVYQVVVPNIGVIHATNAHDRNVEAARRKALMLSIGILTLVSTVAKDVNIFILGGAVTIAMDWNIRHANSVTPDTGQIVTSDETTPATRLAVVQ
jgi:hypothetical protein